MNSDQYHTFASTHWSLLRAADKGEQYKGEAAMNVLLERYRFPMISYLRIKKNMVTYKDQIEDWVHDFIILKIYQKQLLAKAIKKEKQFRPYLKKCLRNYAFDRIRQLKSASKQMPTSPYCDELENELSGADDEDGIFDKSFVQVSLNEAATKTKKHFEKKEDSQAWEIFRLFTWLPGLEGYKRPTATELAQKMSCDSQRIHSANDSVKRYFQTCLLSVISAYASRGEAIADELNELKIILLKMEERRINKRKKNAE